jgi:PAS domain S-box-containing protein
MVRKKSHPHIEKSPAWYANFIDSFPVGIYRSTLEGELVFLNKAFASIFGFESASELIGYPEVDLYHDRKNRGTLIKAVMEKGFVEELSLPFKKNGGTSIWCAVTAWPVFDEDGLVVFLDGLIRDVTGEVNGKDAAPLLDGMFDALDDLIALIDPQGHVLDINRTGAEFLGFHKEALLGKPLFEFIIPRYRELFSMYLCDILRDAREEGIITITDRNGVERHIEFSVSPVKQKRAPHHIKCIARDVTERVRHQREQLMKEKVRGVIEMAGGVAHRLNQPLTIINNIVSDLLSDSITDNSHHDKIVKIHHQIQKLNEIVKKVGGIKKYEAMDYVAGIKIVDIDKAS